jgi:hypothetical protein
MISLKERQRLNLLIERVVEKEIAVVTEEAEWSESDLYHARTALTIYLDTLTEPRIKR